MLHVSRRRLPVKIALGVVATAGIIGGTAYATVLAPAAGTIHARQLEQRLVAGRCRIR